MNATTVLDTTTYVSNFSFSRIILIMNVVFNWKHNLFYTSTVFDGRLLIWNISDDQMHLINAVTLISSTDMTTIRPYLLAIDELSDLFYVFDSNTKKLYKFTFGTTQGIQINIAYPSDVPFYFTDLQLDSSNACYLMDYINHRVAQLVTETSTLRTIAG